MTPTIVPVVGNPAARGVGFMLGDDGITITTPVTTPETELLAMATRFAAIDGTSRANLCKRREGRLESPP
jgi:hypothetical protein